MNDLRVTVDGDTYAVDTVEEAANLSGLTSKTHASSSTSDTRATSGLRQSKTSTTRPATTASGERYGNWSNS